MPFCAIFSPVKLKLGEFEAVVAVDSVSKSAKKFGDLQIRCFICCRFGVQNSEDFSKLATNLYFLSKIVHNCRPFVT